MPATESSPAVVSSQPVSVSPVETKTVMQETYMDLDHSAENEEEAKLTTANLLLQMNQQDTFEYNDDVTPETEMSIPQTPFLAADAPMARQDNVSEEAEALGHGLREPTVEELDKLRKHPFVKQVNDLFSTDVIFARVKNR